MVIPDRPKSRPKSNLTPIVDEDPFVVRPSVFLAGLAWMSFFVILLGLVFHFAPGDWVSFSSLFLSLIVAVCASAIASGKKKKPDNE